MTGRLPILALAAAVLAGSPAAMAAERMNAADIETALDGITLDGIYANGTYFTETYHDDHSIRYWDANGADSGEWSIENGLFCTFYDSLQGACFAVERDGDNCFSFFEVDSNDPSGARADWNSRGWDRTKRSTCPAAPEVSL
jgi:hypothetical protein